MRDKTAQSIRPHLQKTIDELARWFFIWRIERNQTSQLPFTSKQVKVKAGTFLIVSARAGARVYVTHFLPPPRGEREKNASVEIVLRLPHVKLVLKYRRLNINAVNIFAHTATNPFSEAINEEIRGAGLRGGGDIVFTAHPSFAGIE
ncbi:hypothetical protein EVAR_29131_1 [Eumeta japonica]|uniref:Uncharacterized protein n=1 Tax=Eumeta variegata TaxID=151549 RepID=A0A4C1VDI0_EUMVA|nr:hypothetical protein EVAR_29131_1 [Eumeta japonica]